MDFKKTYRPGGRFVEMSEKVGLALSPVSTPPDLAETSL
jgi:hypothetical protein